MKNETTVTNGTTFNHQIKMPSWLMPKDEPTVTEKDPLP